MLRRVIWILLVCSLQGQCTGDVRPKCPRNFDTDFKGSCYFYSHDYESWTGALVSCQVLGGHLVEIETSDEFHFLQKQDRLHSKFEHPTVEKTLFFPIKCVYAKTIISIANNLEPDQKPDGKRWIGLSNKRNSSEWEWATSNTLYDSKNFNMWASGEPDNRKGTGDESCAVMDYFQALSHDFTLADVNCISPQQKYICEYTPRLLPDFVGK